MTINSVAPIASSLGVSAPVAVLAPVLAAVASNSGTACEAMMCPQALGPSLATGMSRDPANAGGEHEAVTALPLNDLDASATFENTSLLVAGANLNDKRTGTAPGASGPERDFFGATNSVSDGVGERSLPSGEIEPSVMLASAPFEFSSGDGLGNLEPGSITSGDRFAVTAGSGRARNRAAYPAITGNSSCGGRHVGGRREPLNWVAGSIPARASIATGPQDSNSNPETSSLVPVDSAALSNVDAPPLFLSVDPELEAAICALEAEWAPLRASLSDPLAIPSFLDRRNSKTFRVVAINDSALNDVSKFISSGVE